MNDTTTADLPVSKKSPEIVALTGFMGCGKTTTGRELAELLGWVFVDLDETVEQQERVSVREVFGQRGEAAFRAIEHRALKSCLTERSNPTVLALGGGAFVQLNNVELLASNQVSTVFLEAPVEEMLQRCGVKDEPDPEHPRPLAADTAAFCSLYEKRLPLYRAADLTVSTMGKTVTEVAHEIVEKLQLYTLR